MNAAILQLLKLSEFLKDHGFDVGYKAGDESVNSIHYETFLPRTSFSNGTALVPMDQIGWRMITELMEYTSAKDQHYTNSPKDRGQALGEL